MAFFKNFPDATFVFDGKSFTLEDLTRRVIFDPDAFSNYLFVDDFDIGEDRPDVVAYKVYGNVNFWWSFFVVNNITINEWPLTDEELDDWMTSRYTPFQLNQVYRFVDSNGDEMPRYGFPKFKVGDLNVNYAFNREDFLDSNKRMTMSAHMSQTLSEYLIEENEKRKKIRVVRPEYIGRFAEDFRKRLTSLVSHE